MKDIDTMEAAIRVMGRPWNDSGISMFSMRPRTPAKGTIASRKPRPAPRALTDGLAEIVLLYRY